MTGGAAVHSNLCGLLPSGPSGDEKAELTGISSQQKARLRIFTSRTLWLSWEERVKHVTKGHLLNAPKLRRQWRAGAPEVRRSRSVRVLTFLLVVRSLVSVCRENRPMMAMPPDAPMTPEVASPYAPSRPIAGHGRYEGNVSQASPVQKADSKATTD